MASALTFWFTCLVIAAFSLPVTFRVFRRFPDGGAGLALPLGLFLTGSGYFLLRTCDVLPFGQGGFIVAIALLGLLGAAVAGRDPHFSATAHRSARPALAVLIVFTIAFFAYATFRSYQPTIGGTEQPMDLLFLNAMLQSESYPPADPWLAGEPVSYYYFGYLQSAIVVGAANIEGSVGYNLALAGVFASAAAAIVSVAAALSRWSLGRLRGNWPVVASALGIVLLLFAGSLVGAFEFAAAHEVYPRPLYETFGVDQLLPCEGGAIDDCYGGATNPRTTAWYPTEYWFWWDATRIIPGTIIEFPIFSFILGDLHPHVMAIPGVILAVALAALSWRGRSELSWRTHLRSPWFGILLAVVFGGLAFQNAWDVLTLSALLAVAVFARNLRHLPWSTAIPATLGYLAPAGALAIVFYAPWLLDFSSQASGVYAYTGQGSAPAHAFLQFGTLTLVAALGFLALRRVPGSGLATIALYTVWVPLIPLLAWAALAAFRGDWSTAVDERGAGGWATLVILVAVVWAFVTGAVALHQRRNPAAPLMALASAGVILVFLAELFFIRDVFFGSVPRLNTVFKLTYQAWILLSIAGAAALTVAAQRARLGNIAATAALLPVIAVVALALLYALGAIPNRADGFSGPTSIDGLSELARNDPDEYALTRWIAGNTSPGDIVLEATGRTWRQADDGLVIEDAGVDYTDAGRIASRTGRSTPIGWFFHEIQWRGETPANRDEFTRRQDAVDGVYLAQSPSHALESLRNLGADYVVMGRIEQSRYPASAVVDFSAILDVAFESGDLRVYRVPVNEAVPTS